MKINSAIDVFDEWAKSGKDQGMESGHNKSGNRIIQIAHERVNPSASDKYSVLDLGCGNGWLLRKATKAFLDSVGVGIDGSSTMIQKAQLRDSSNTYLSENLNTWKPDSRYDIIISMEFLYYLGDVKTFIQKVKTEYINSGGLFVFGIDHYIENKSSLSWPADLNVKMTTLSIQDWKNLLEAADFKEVRFEQFNKSKDWEGTLIFSCLSS